MNYRGLIYHDAYNFTMEECEMPPCGEKDVILKNIVASVCGSDGDVWLNGGALHYFPPDVEFGHEVACVVHEVGSAVQDVNVGDRVAPFPLKTTPNPRKAGFLGGFSEYIYCTDASYDFNLFKLPDNVSDEEASLIEPLTVGIRGAEVAMNAVKKENGIYLILGAGFIGFSTACSLAYAGVDRDHITLVDRCENRLEICRKEGFFGVNTTQENWQQRVYECTGGGYTAYGPGSAADAIIDCAGSINPNSTDPTLMDYGIKMLKYFGKFVCVGVHRRQPRVDFQKLVFGMVDILCGSGAGSRSYYETAIEMLASKEFDFAGTITHTYPHAETKDAIVFSINADQCMKLVVDYRL